MAVAAPDLNPVPSLPSDMVEITGTNPSCLIEVAIMQHAVREQKSPYSKLCSSLHQLCAGYSTSPSACLFQHTQDCTLKHELLLQQATCLPMWVCFFIQLVQAQLLKPHGHSRNTMQGCQFYILGISLHFHFKVEELCGNIKHVGESRFSLPFYQHVRS